MFIYVEDIKVWLIFVRFVCISLVIFLMKFWGGDLNCIFFILFNIFKFSVYRSIKLIRIVLMNGRFVKENFGFGYIIREMVI